MSESTNADTHLSLEQQHADTQGLLEEMNDDVEHVNEQTESEEASDTVAAAGDATTDAAEFSFSTHPDFHHFLHLASHLKSSQLEVREARERWRRLLFFQRNSVLWQEEDAAARFDFDRCTQRTEEATAETDAADEQTAADPCALSQQPCHFDRVRFPLALQLKAEGGELYHRGAYADASLRYQRAIALFQFARRVDTAHGEDIQWCDILKEQQEEEGEEAEEEDSDSEADAETAAAHSPQRRSRSVSPAAAADSAAAASVDTAAAAVSSPRSLLALAASRSPSFLPPCYLPSLKPQQRLRGKQLVFTCLLNVAACEEKMKNWLNVIDCSEKSLAIEFNRVRHSSSEDAAEGEEEEGEEGSASASAESAFLTPDTRDRANSVLTTPLPPIEAHARTQSLCFDSPPLQPQPQPQQRRARTMSAIDSSALYPYPIRDDDSAAVTAAVAASVAAATATEAMVQQGRDDAAVAAVAAAAEAAGAQQQETDATAHNIAQSHPDAATVTTYSSTQSDLPVAAPAAAETRTAEDAASSEPTATGAAVSDVAATAADTAALSSPLPPAPAAAVLSPSQQPTSFLSPPPPRARFRSRTSSSLSLFSTPSLRSSSSSSSSPADTLRSSSSSSFSHPDPTFNLAALTTKALFRCARARRQMDELETPIALLRRAQQLAPTDNLIRSTLRNWQRESAQANRKQQHTFAGMFKRGEVYDTDSSQQMQLQERTAHQSDLQLPLTNAHSSTHPPAAHSRTDTHTSSSALSTSTEDTATFISDFMRGFADVPPVTESGEGGTSEWQPRKRKRKSVTEAAPDSSGDAPAVAPPIFRSLSPAPFASSSPTIPVHHRHRSSATDNPALLAAMFEEARRNFGIDLSDPVVQEELRRLQAEHKRTGKLSDIDNADASASMSDTSTSAHMRGDETNNKYLGMLILITVLAFMLRAANLL